MNAVPRITIYPLIVIIFGFGFGSKVIGAFLVSFFLVFYNAYQGSKSVPAELIESYSFLGARRWHLVRYIRAYVALGWAIALLPSAVAFALISVITTEIRATTSGETRSSSAIRRITSERTAGGRLVIREAA